MSTSPSTFLWPARRAQISLWTRWLTAALFAVFASLAWGCARQHAQSTSAVQPAAAPQAAALNPAATPASHSHNHEHDQLAASGHTHDHPHQHTASDPSAPCTCDSASLHNGWCRKCNVGYVAGYRVESALLFETLDPHGHVVDRATFECESCRRAAATGGYCQTCNVGFVGSLAYFTLLTWSVGQGVGMNAEEVSCERCRSLWGSAGWCDECSRGVVGNVIIIQPEVFAIAAAEFQTLQAAVQKVPECELCACAMVVHRTCPKCLISYEIPGTQPAVKSVPPRGG